MNAIFLPAQRAFKWNVFWIGLALYLAAAIAGIPLARTMQPLAQGESRLARVSLELGQYLLVGVLSLGVGLWLGGRIGLGAPFIQGWVEKAPVWDRLRGVLSLSLFVAIIGSLAMLAFGLVLTVVVVALGIVPLDAMAEAGAWTESYPALWKWFLVSISAGVTEEVAFRLGLMTLLAWLGSLVCRDDSGQPRAAVLWIANILAALVFGAAHLGGIIPVPLTPVFIVRTVAQNAIVGTALGRLYWRRGLESAVLTHFLFDVVTYVVVLPTLQSSSPLLMVCTLVGLILASVISWRQFVRRPRKGAGE
ncbi:MAG: CPBP family intramembrane metalloprotease [Anaerolineae bacterium]|jgi:membrane protease YdiL (CAAX protease family)